MKLKNILIIAVIVIVCIASYNVIMEEGGNSGLKDDIINSLPEEITSCYYVDENNQEILNTMAVKNLTIDREITDGNFKTVECTIETEGQDLDRTVYATFGCVRYDNGQWEIQDFSRTSDYKIVPKTIPQETSFASYIKKTEGFQNIVKVNEIFDESFNQMMYYYTVHDTYDYITFAGEGICCTATLENTEGYNYGLDRYYWLYTTENNTEIVWDVLGTWHLDGSISGNPPYSTADITVNTIASEECGTSTYSYPCVDGSYYTGEYNTFSDVAYCYFEGSNPLDAKCILTGYESKVIITCEGVEGFVSSDSYQTTVSRQ